MTTYESRVPQRLRGIHYKILEMDLAGVRIESIATTVGMSIQGIFLVRKMPAYQTELANMRREARQKAIELIADEALASVRHIISVRDDPEAPKAIRLKAAMTLLDRFLPTSSAQRNEQHTNDDGPLFDPMALLRLITTMQHIPDMQPDMQRMVAELKDSLNEAAIEQEVQRRLQEYLGLSERIINIEPETPHQLPPFMDESHTNGPSK
jgi:hypothetical protein